MSLTCLPHVNLPGVEKRAPGARVVVKAAEPDAQQAFVCVIQVHQVWVMCPYASGYGDMPAR